MKYMPRQNVMELCAVCGLQIPLNQMPDHLSQCEVLMEEEHKFKLFTKQKKDHTSKKKKKKKKDGKKKRREKILSTIDELSNKKISIDDFEILKRISAGAFGYLPLPLPLSPPPLIL